MSSFSVAVIKHTAKATYREKGLLLVQRNKEESFIFMCDGGSRQAWGESSKMKTSVVVHKHKAETGNGNEWRVDFETLKPASSKVTPPKPTQTAPPSGDQVLKQLCLQGTFLTQTVPASKKYTEPDTLTAFLKFYFLA